MSQTAETDARAAADELQQLLGEETVEVGSETVTVREFTFREGMSVAPVARPILADFQELVERQAEGTEDLAAGDILQVMEAHPDAWFRLIAQACGRDPDWVAALPEGAGTRLGIVFWRLNAAFFTRRLVSGALAKGAREREAAGSASSGSSTS
jgi:hypothetical protein